MSDDRDGSLEQLADRILAVGQAEAVRDLLLEAHLRQEDALELLHVLRIRSFSWSAGAALDRVRNAWRLVWATAVITPHALAPMLHGLGRAFSASGFYSNAPELLEGARLAYEQTGDRDGWARATNTLASTHYSLGLYQSAERYAREAVDFFRADPSQADAEAVCWLTLGNILADRQQPDDALAAFQKSIEACQRAAHPNQQFIASAYVGIGRVLEEQGDDFVGAAEYFEKASAIFQQLRSADWRSLFTLRLNRALLALRLGRHAEARQGFALAEQVVAEGQETDLFDIYMYRAYQSLLLGGTNVARSLFAQAFALRKEAADPEVLRKDVADLEAVLSRLGQHQRQIVDAYFFQVLLGQAGAASIELLQALDRAYRRLGLQLAPALIAMEQARLHYLGEAWQEARTALDQAREVLERFFSSAPPPHRMRELEVLRAEYDPDVTLAELNALLQRIQATPDPNQLLPVLFRIGLLREQQHQRGAALATYRYAAEVVVQVNGLARLSIQTARVLQRMRLPFERIFALSAGAAPDDAYMAAEQMRVQLLLDDLVNEGAETALLGDTSDPALRELQRCREQLRMVQARTQLLRPRGFAANQRSVLVEPAGELYEAQIAYDQAMQDVRAQRWDRTEILFIKDAEHYTATQRWLTPGTAILSYFLVGPSGPHAVRSSGELWATVLTHSGPPHVQRLLRASGVRELLSQYSEIFQLISTERQETRLVAEVLDRLTEDLLGPIWLRLQHCQRLIVVPDDRLPLFPFHALRPDGGAYLIERCVVSYSPSATVLGLYRQREQRRTPGRGALVAGWKGVRDSRLPYVDQELRTVAGLLASQPHFGPLALGDLQPALTDARVVHLACHGSFANQAGDLHPRFAFLDLGRDHLYAYDLYGMRLCADLLTLSACETAQAGEGLQGLVSAGLAAGASSVIASLWRVSDQSAAALMQHFYPKLLQEGLGRAEALRQAQLAVLQEHRAPSLWAPFVLIGVPDPLPRIEQRGGLGGQPAPPRES